MKHKQTADAKRGNIGIGLPYYEMPQPPLQRDNLMPVEVHHWLNSYARKEGRQ